MKMSIDCVETLKLNGVNEIGKIIFTPELNPDDTPKDWVGGMIFNYMTKLHGLRFGILTDDTIERFMGYLICDLTCENWDTEPYKIFGNSITVNIIGILKTIIRLLVVYDRRFTIGT